MARDQSAFIKKVLPQVAKDSCVLHSLRRFYELADAEPKGWLVDGIIPKSGLVLFFGDPHAGKTSFLAIACMHIGAGKPLLGRDVARGKVVWVMAEHKKTELATYLRHSAKALGLGRKEQARLEKRVRVMVADDWSLDDPDQVESLRKKLDELDVVIVVLDSLRRLSSCEESMSEQARRVMKAAEALSSNGKRVVVLIHHKTKSGVTPRGSGDFVAAADCKIYLEVKRGTKRLTATHHANPEVKLRFNIAFDADRMDLEATATNNTCGSVEKRDVVRDAIENVLRAGGALPKTKLRAATRMTVEDGAGNDLIDKALQSLIDEERVAEAKGTGTTKLYSLTQPA